MLWPDIAADPSKHQDCEGANSAFARQRAQPGRAPLRLFDTRCAHYIPEACERKTVTSNHGCDRGLVHGGLRVGGGTPATSTSARPRRVRCDDQCQRVARKDKNACFSRNGAGGGRVAQQVMAGALRKCTARPAATSCLTVGQPFAEQMGRNSGGVLDVACGRPAASHSIPACWGPRASHPPHPRVWWQLRPLEVRRDGRLCMLRGTARLPIPQCPGKCLWDERPAPDDACNTPPLLSGRTRRRLPRRVSGSFPSTSSATATRTSLTRGSCRGMRCTTLRRGAGRWWISWTRSCKARRPWCATAWAGSRGSMPPSAPRGRCPW